MVNISEINMQADLLVDGIKRSSTWVLQELYHDRKPSSPIIHLETNDEVHIDVTKKDIGIIFFCNHCEAVCSIDSCFECESDEHMVELYVLRNDIHTKNRLIPHIQVLPDDTEIEVEFSNFPDMPGIIAKYTFEKQEVIELLQINGYYFNGVTAMLDGPRIGMGFFTDRKIQIPELLREEAKAYMQQNINDIYGAYIRKPQELISRFYDDYNAEQAI